MFALWLTTTYVPTSQEPYAIANPAQRRRKQSPKMGVKSYAWCWASTFFQVFGLFIRKLPNERAFLICLCKSHFGNDTVAPKRWPRTPSGKQDWKDEHCKPRYSVSRLYDRTIAAPQTLDPSVLLWLPCGIGMWFSLFDHIHKSIIDSRTFPCFVTLSTLFWA